MLGHFRPWRSAIVGENGSGSGLHNLELPESSNETAVVAAIEELYSRAKEGRVPFSLMKCNAILEASITIATEGDMSKWHGATLLSGGYSFCLRRLEKTLSVTVRDGTNAQVRAAGGRGALSQRRARTPHRRTDRSASSLFSECTVRRARHVDAFSSAGCWKPSVVKLRFGDAILGQAHPFEVGRGRDRTRASRG